MTELRMRRLWPLGPWPLLVPAMLVVLVVLSGTSSMWSWPYQDWLVTSSAFMTQLAVPGPIAAAAGAYYASRLTGRGRIFALRPGGRAPREVLVRHLAQLLAWLLTAYVLGLTPLLALSVAGADAGHLSVGVAGTGLAGLALFVLVGYALGAATGSITAVPIAFVVSLGVVVLGTTATTPLSPVPSFSFAVGDVPAVGLLAVRLVVMLLLALACVALSGSRIGGSRRPPAITLVAAAAVVAFAVLAKLNAPAVRSLDTDPPLVCSTAAAVETCVHQGNRRQLAAVADAARPVLDAYGPPPAASTWRVYDAALSGGPASREHVLWVGVAPENDESDTVPSDVVGQLIPIEACTNRYGFQLPDDVEGLYTYLQTWLRNGGERPARYDYPHFRKSSPTQLRSWLADHRQQLDSCDVDLQRLPA